MKTLVEKNLDLQPAEALVKKHILPSHDSILGNQGSLVSVGRGLDSERVTGRLSTFPIFAMPYGEAGHILRIVRPKIQRRGWEKKSCRVPICPFLVLVNSDIFQLFQPVFSSQMGPMKVTIVLDLQVPLIKSRSPTKKMVPVLGSP